MLAFERDSEDLILKLRFSILNVLYSTSSSVGCGRFRGHVVFKFSGIRENVGHDPYESGIIFSFFVC